LSDLGASGVCVLYVLIGSSWGQLGAGRLG
jgi:hypothetical protein